MTGHIDAHSTLRPHYVWLLTPQSEVGVLHSQAVVSKLLTESELPAEATVFRAHQSWKTVRVLHGEARFVATCTGGQEPADPETRIWKPVDTAGSCSTPHTL